MWGCGTVVARPLCMRQVRGSIPRFSKQATFNWSRVRLTLGAFQCTHSSVVERLIAASFFAIDFSLSWMRRRELSLVDAAADAPDDASGRAMDCSFFLSPFDFS